jgi:hypothetical protein
MRVPFRRVVARRPKVIGGLAAIAAVLLVVGQVAFAGSVSSGTNPIVVPGDAAGNPLAINVVATGFPEGEGLAFVEQCDGVDPGTAGYSPLTHCDSATSPAATDVGADGVASFPASDPNFAFTPFKGQSPQHKFNCVAPGESAPSAKPTFSNCQIRVSTNNLATTTDQAYFTITLPATVLHTPSDIGSCTGQVGLATNKNATNATTPLGDQTTQGVAQPTALLKNLADSAKPVLGGSCSIKLRKGDATHPAGGTLALTPKAFTGKFVGNISCATSGAADGVDATIGDAYEASGKFTMPMVELNDLLKPYSIQMQLTVSGRNALGQDVVDVDGTVLKGPGTGSHVSGSLWVAPVAKAPKGTLASATAYGTGYVLDNTAKNACHDGTAGNASVGFYLFGGGGTSATSPEGHTATGLHFDLG